MDDHIREQLRASDPVAMEPRPDPGELGRMRRTILAAAGGGAPVLDSWRRPVSLAAVMAVLLVVLGGVSPWVAQRFGHPAGGADGTAPRRVDATSRRQLQFVTTGGTRIIWILNDGLDEWRQR
jgi:hypothetical protein